MAITAPSRMSNCINCSQPINRGDIIETTTVNSELRYVHQACAKKPQTGLIKLKTGSGSTPGRSKVVDDARKLLFDDSETVSQEPPKTRLIQSGTENLKMPEVESEVEDTDSNITEDQPRKHPSPRDQEKLFDRVVSEAGRIAAEQVATKTASIISNATSGAIARIESSIESEARKAVQEHIDGMGAEVKAAGEEIGEELKREIREQMEKELAKVRSCQRVEHIVKVEDVETKFEEDEVFHEVFDEVLKLSANGFLVFLPGPSGCGKRHLSRQVAKALALPFGMISGSGGVKESDVLGRSFPNVATGESVYVPSQFVTIYENGGLFLIDEMDAMDPNMLLTFNSALANGELSIPTRFDKPIAKMHRNFRCIAAANTFGNGANRMYCGRNKLDESTLDRFRGGTVPLDYDPNVEIRWACPDPELHELLSGWRAKIVENGLHRIISTRFMGQAYKLKKLGYSTKAIARKLVGGWSPKDILTVTGYTIEQLS